KGIGNETMKSNQLQSRARMAAGGAPSVAGWHCKIKLPVASRLRPVRRRPWTLFSFLSCWLALLPGICCAEPFSDAELLKLKHAVVTNYAALVCAATKDSLAAARNLKTAVDVLLTKPSERSLNAAREAWLAARVPYDQTEAFRFYDGPIDQVEGKINAWPIDESYIDYVA